MSLKATQISYAPHRGSGIQINAFGPGGLVTRTVRRTGAAAEAAAGAIIRHSEGAAKVDVIPAPDTEMEFVVDDHVIHRFRFTFQGPDARVDPAGAAVATEAARDVAVATAAEAARLESGAGSEEKKDASSAAASAAAVTLPAQPVNDAVGVTVIPIKRPRQFGKMTFVLRPKGGRVLGISTAHMGIRIEGNVMSTVYSQNGDIRVRGTVRGDVTTVNGDVDATQIVGSIRSAGTSMHTHVQTVGAVGRQTATVISNSFGGRGDGGADRKRARK